VHNSKVNQHIVVANNAAEAEQGEEKLALALIV
jgi:hypothetical protein